MIAACTHRAFHLGCCALLLVLAGRVRAQQSEGSASAELNVAVDGGDAFAHDFGSIEAQSARAMSSLQGATGGLHLVDGASGLPGSVRLQLQLTYFRGSDFLASGDVNESVDGALALDVTLAEHLEVFGTFHNRSNSNSLNRPVLLQAVGDSMLGIKGFTALAPWFGLGADLRVQLYNNVGDLGYALDGTSVGLRGAATFDLRRVEAPMPVILRGNVQYFVDNTAALVADLEQARYDALPASARRTPLSEDRHLLTRAERLAFGVNRVDTFTLGLGAEVPLRAAPDFFVHPLMEWRFNLPVNRQGYDCLAVDTKAHVDQPDGCLGVVGLTAAPATLSLGARVAPPVRGLFATLGFDIGLSGTGTFVRELAPNLPWALLVMLQYGTDGRRDTAAPAAVAVPAPVAAAAPVPQGPARVRVYGVVVAAGSDAPVAEAVLRYTHGSLTAQLTAADGTFTTYELSPGEVQLQVSHPSFESSLCTFTVPATRPKAASSTSASGLSPVDLQSPDGAAAGAASAQGQESLAIRCELTAVAAPEPIAVPTPEPVVQPTPAVVTPPAAAQVVLTSRELRLRRPIIFQHNSTQIDERSLPLMREIADTLLQNPQVEHVQIQGHTDNSGDSGHNQRVSEERARAVKLWLVDNGVASDRLDAKGYGDSRPLAPNITDANRARNRRVQFVIK